MPKGKKGRRASSDVAALRFSGGRYEAKGFPLEGIDELEKYQRLVLAAAKKIWREKNPTAARLPNHFADRLRLRLTHVEKGSVIPVIQRETQIEIAGAPDLLQQSIDYVDDAFEAIVERLQVPADLTDEFRSALWLFGASLRDNERATFRDRSKSPIVYTVETRRALLDLLRRDASVDSGTLIGTIRMLDAAQEFILSDAHDRPIPGRFSKTTIFDELHELLALRDDADLVWVTCVFESEPETGAVLKIDDVQDAGQFAKSTNAGAKRLAALTQFGDGWLEGEGSRVELVALSAGLEILDRIDHDGLPQPSVFPSMEGGVRFEWLTSTSHTTLSVNNDAVYEGYHLNIATGEEDGADDLRGANTALNFVRGYLE